MACRWPDRAEERGGRGRDDLERLRPAADLQGEIPSLLRYNELLVVSDGLQARIGSLTASQEWFKVWRTIDGEQDAPKTALELEVLVRGVFAPRRFLDLLQHFIAFEEDPDTGRAPQDHRRLSPVPRGQRRGRGDGARQRDRRHRRALLGGRMHGGQPGDRRAGVVWHTQGSGKSFSMLFFAARMVRHPAMQNPTLVVLTDRNDLDDQLFGQFQRCPRSSARRPCRPPAASTCASCYRGQRRRGLHHHPEVPPPREGRADAGAERAPEHRRHRRRGAPQPVRPQSTGWPASTCATRCPMPPSSASRHAHREEDANTRAVFGDYISIYDIQRAVADKATVPIYYESRIAKLGLNAAELPKLDAEFEEITEGEEQTRKEQLKSKWAALEALVGDPKRIALIAADLVAHFERRLEAMDGKAMIVCMSRRICVDLYDALIGCAPTGPAPRDDDPEAEKGKSCVVKVVMTGSADDGPEWQPHIRNKDKRRKLANRFKDSKDPFRIVIVRDMWLTGFDAPCLHTMYADKPMQGHGLMQAIARVNRVFRDKPGGLVVDYLGLADQLKQALATYTESGGQGDPTFDTAQAIA
jgi:type I restriction enzyme R subunit